MIVLRLKNVHRFVIHFFSISTNIRRFFEISAKKWSNLKFDVKNKKLLSNIKKKNYFFGILVNVNKVSEIRENSRTWVEIEK